MQYDLAHYSLSGARPTNQDRVAVAERDRATLLVLADGLGGHEGGALAAETLIQVAVRLFQQVHQPQIHQPSTFLAFAILRAHRTIIEQGRAHVPPISPRTTCVLCLVQDGYAYWAHVGDSRLYHYRGTRLLTRTEDHTIAEELRREGVLSEREMQVHPEKSRLLKAVGGPFAPSISLGPETALEENDTLLLCSDGLWEAIEPTEIPGYLLRASLEDGIEEMLLAAEHRMKQACDNLSAIGLRWREPRTRVPPLQPQPASRGAWPGSKLPDGSEVPRSSTDPLALEAEYRAVEKMLRGSTRRT